MADIDTGQKPYIDWLRQQYEQEQVKLRKLKEEKEKLLKIEAEICKTIDSYAQIIKVQLSSTDSEVSSNIRAEAPEDRQKSPIEMLRTEFSGMSMSEVIGMLLNIHGKPVHALDLAREAYEVEEDSEDFKRARDSMNSALKDGVDKKWLVRVERGVYALPEHAQPSLSQFDFEPNQNGSVQQHSYAYKGSGYDNF